MAHETLDQKIARKRAEKIARQEKLDQIHRDAVASMDGELEFSADVTVRDGQIISIDPVQSDRKLPK